MQAQPANAVPMVPQPQGAATSQANPATEQYDLIVIGSGLGAMAAAAIQARRGQRVLVVEKHTVLGGYASVFARDGLTFDVSLHQIGGVRKTRVKGILEEAGVYDKLGFVKSPTLSHLHYNPDHPTLPIPNGDMNAFKRMLLDRFPQERRAIRLWFWVMCSFGRQLAYFDRVRTRNPFKQAVVIFLAPVFAPFLVLSSFWNPPLALALRTRNADLRKILLHFSGYYGLPAHEINMLYPMVANYSYYSDGGYYLKGGGYEIVRQLSMVVRRNGGKILTGQTVTEIVTEGDKVSGVRLARNERQVMHAPQIVCGANPLVVYANLLPNHPIAAREHARVSNMDIGMTCSVLYLRIDVPVGHLNPALEGVYEFVEPPAHDEATYYETFRTRKDFNGGYHDDGINMTVHSVADPDALKGTPGALLDIFYADNHDRWAGLDEHAYRAQKKIEIAKILDSVERHLPGLRAHIKTMELATPLTMERYTSNPKGAIYGFAQTPAQSSKKRFGIHSPLRGLSFVSAWSDPGGGYEGVLRAADTFTHPIMRTSLGIFAALVVTSILSGTVVEHVLHWFAGAGG